MSEPACDSCAEYGACPAHPPIDISRQELPSYARSRCSLCGSRAHEGSCTPTFDAIQRGELTGTARFTVESGRISATESARASQDPPDLHRAMNQVCAEVPDSFPSRIVLGEGVPYRMPSVLFVGMLDDGGHPVSLGDNALPGGRYRLVLERIG